VVPIPGCTGGPYGVGPTIGGQPLDCDLGELLQLLEGRADPHALERLCGTEGGGEVVAGDGGASAMFARPRTGVTLPEAAPAR
jgi:hypothetical protein